MLDIIMALIIPSGKRDEPRGPVFVFLAMLFCISVIVILSLLS
jgi:hypothetical protein